MNTQGAGLKSAAAVAITTVALLIGVGPATASAAAPSTDQSRSTTLTATPTSVISAPSALAVYRDSTATEDTFHMSARAPRTGGTDLNGIYFVLKDVKTGQEIANSWAGNPIGEQRPVLFTDISLDRSTVDYFKNDNLVVTATAYGNDGGISVSPARAMIYAQNRAQVQRVNRVRTTWNADGSLTLTWNSPNYSGDGRVVVYLIWNAAGIEIAQPSVDPDPYASTTGINTLVLNPATAATVGGKIQIDAGVDNPNLRGDPWSVAVPSRPVPPQQSL